MRCFGLKILKIFPGLAVVVLVAVVAGCNGKDEDPPAPTGDPVVVKGYELALRNSCFSCHSVEASKPTGPTKSGPTLKGLAGSEVELTDGSKVTVDDNYLRLALTDPDAQIRSGYRKGAMSSFMNARDELSTEEVDAIVAYLKTLK